MSNDQLELVQAQLRSTNEGLRLKACNLLSKESPSWAGECVPLLKEIFWKDPNPAVKFLAKKALVQLGETIEELQKSPESVVPADAKTGHFQLIPDGSILWKCASDVLRPCVSRLFHLINSSDPSVMDQTSEALEKLGSALSAAPLIEAFQREQQSPEWAKQEVLMAASYEDVNDLIHIAKLKHSGINPATAAAMGNLNCPEVKETFIDMLRSFNPILRNNAVRILADLSDPHTVDPLLSLLGSDNQALETKVIKTVSKIAADNGEVQDVVLKGILKHFRPGEPERKLYAIVDALGRIANPKTLPLVLRCMTHKLPRMRANAVEAYLCFEVPEDELVKTLRPLLQDPNNRVVSNVIVGLWRTMAHEEAKARTLELVHHSEKWHRASVAYALGVIDTEESGGLLIELLRDPDEDVRRNAAQALRKIENNDAISRLVEFINDDDMEVRIYSIEQIGKSANEAYNDILQLILDTESHPRVVASTILALGRMKLPENVATLAFFLNAEDARIRANAIEALENINDPKVMSLLQLNVNDPDGRVKANAVSALWRFGELRVADTLQEMLRNPSEGQQSSGAWALGIMAKTARRERTLIKYPLLIAALRQHPKYAVLKQIASDLA